MPSKVTEEGGELEEGGWVGVSRSLEGAFRQAVNAARQPDGTVLKVKDIYVISVDDPNVGGYRVEIQPGG